jgi:hypothetical protein
VEEETYVVCFLLLTVSSIRNTRLKTIIPLGVHPTVSHAFLCTSELLNEAALGVGEGRAKDSRVGSGDEIGRCLRSVMSRGWEFKRREAGDVAVLVFSSVLAFLASFLPHNTN